MVAAWLTACSRRAHGRCMLPHPKCQAAVSVSVSASRVVPCHVMSVQRVSAASLRLQPTPWCSLISSEPHRETNMRLMQVGLSEESRCDRLIDSSGPATRAPDACGGCLALRVVLIRVLPLRGLPAGLVHAAGKWEARCRADVQTQTQMQTVRLQHPGAWLRLPRSLRRYAEVQCRRDSPVRLVNADSSQHRLISAPTDQQRRDMRI
jgi:hypothetical protein